MSKFGLKILRKKMLGVGGVIGQGEGGVVGGV